MKTAILTSRSGNEVEIKVDEVDAFQGTQDGTAVYFLNGGVLYVTEDFFEVEEKLNGKTWKQERQK